MNRTLDEFMRNLIFLRLATRYSRLIPITALAIMGCFTAANVAYGQQDVVRIAAIVNDEIISGFDLEKSCTPRCDFDKFI